MALWQDYDQSGRIVIRLGGDEITVTNETIRAYKDKCIRPLVRLIPSDCPR